MIPPLCRWRRCFENAIGRAKDNQRLDPCPTHTVAHEARNVSCLYDKNGNPTQLDAAGR